MSAPSSNEGGTDFLFELRWHANKLLCRIFGHRRKVWEGGHVYADDDWNGEWHDDHPWVGSFASCDRCGVNL